MLCFFFFSNLQFALVGEESGTALCLSLAVSAVGGGEREKLI